MSIKRFTGDNNVVGNVGWCTGNDKVVPQAPKPEKGEEHSTSWRETREQHRGSMVSKDHGDKRTMKKSARTDEVNEAKSSWW